MKQTLTTGQCVHQLLMDDEARWTYKGAEALVKYLEQEEMEGGEEEFWPAEIRQAWSEYSSALECLEDCCPPEDIPDDEDEDEDEREEECLRYLNEKTCVLSFEGGIIVAAW